MEKSVILLEGEKDLSWQSFLHLTSEWNLPGIQWVGIQSEAIHYSEASKGVFCMPVSSDFFAIHQWARELIRFGMQNPLGVCFRIPDGEDVVVGYYNERPARARRRRLYRHSEIKWARWASR